jgi:hypothetical protein
MLDFYDEEDLNREMLVICSGDLIKQTHISTSRHKSFQYMIDIPTSSSSIVLAIGPFEVVRIPNWEPSIVNAPQEKVVETEDEKDAEPSRGGYAFCLPGYNEELLNTISPLHDVLFYM